ncbi:MBL fold metallo-hydrolase [Streptomyces sp. NPDC056749]|uniref:MBL fold metallo-hydrolase n=1 Tax=Streptomyces sp. NPDC056749 TaxID=3345936 RepID=UPI0036ADB614
MRNACLVPSRSAGNAPARPCAVGPGGTAGPGRPPGGGRRRACVRRRFPGGAPTGHASVSTGIHLPRHDVLFTGDAVAGVGGVVPGVFDTDHARAAASFRRLTALGPATACFGHGDPLPVDARSAAPRDRG